jgi:lipopolysaccharide export system protein LptC
MNRMVVGSRDRGTPGYAAQRVSSEGHAAFRGAARHSRRVRFMRRAIPVGIGVAVAAIVLSSFFNPLRFVYKLPNDLGTLVVSGSKITMESPRLAGVTRDARAYEIQAKAAAQDIKKPNVVELKEIRAKVDMQDKTSVEMTAVDGNYDTKAELLTLGQKIILSSSTGYQGILTEAVVDIKKGRIVSEKPVEVKMLQGTLNANRLEVTDTGALIRFDGGVTMMLTPEALNRGINQAATPATTVEAKK